MVPNCLELILFISFSHPNERQELLLQDFQTSFKDHKYSSLLPKIQGHQINKKTIGSHFYHLIFEHVTPLLNWNIFFLFQTVRNGTKIPYEHLEKTNNPTHTHTAFLPLHSIRAKNCQAVWKNFFL